MRVRGDLAQHPGRELVDLDPVRHEIHHRHPRPIGREGRRAWFEGITGTG